MLPIPKYSCGQEPNCSTCDGRGVCTVPFYQRPDGHLDALPAGLCIHDAIVKGRTHERRLVTHCLHVQISGGEDSTNTHQCNNHPCHLPK